MSDTPTDLSHLLASRYRDPTPGERVRMTAAMFRVATTLARAGIQWRYGKATDSEVRQLLLRRLYGDELTEAQLSEIARAQARKAERESDQS